LRTDTNQVWLRFMDGPPVSEATIAFLEWSCQQLSHEGKKALLLVWDNASWHISALGKDWISQHNRTAKGEGGVRILSCLLPVKSPWLNPIEPHWIHGKRAIVEADRKLTAEEVEERVCDYFGCSIFDHIVIAKQVG
jgi:hypothetical protein